MLSKRIIALLMLLLIATAYSIATLYVDNPNLTDTASSAYQSSNVNNVSKQYLSTSKASPYLESKLHGSPDIDDSTRSLLHDDEVTFLVVGIDVLSTQARALIEFKGTLYKVIGGDLILNNTVRVLQINTDHIVYQVGNRTLTKYLVEPNLLQPSSAQTALTTQDYLSMTAKQIGTRPRILSHIVTYTPTPYIADGMLIEPGINSDLFSQIGFKEDDVLKRVNGMSVTVEEQRAVINELMQSAHTLEFEVMRKGRLITLYLDIPSEALKVSK
ncbi:MAG: hypothetical protein WA981_11540 [Glaciecola sp.]